HVREKFRPYTDHGGHDAEDGRGLRYLEWTWDPDPSDDTYIVDFACLLREADGTMRVERDRHTEGVFSRETWLGPRRDVGFEPKLLPFDHSELDPGSYEIFVARKA